MSCLITLLALAIGFMGLLEIFPSLDPGTCWNLITFIVGIWMPSPRLKPTKEQRSNTPPASSTNTSIYDSEEDEDGVEEEAHEAIVVNTEERAVVPAP